MLPVIVRFGARRVSSAQAAAQMAQETSQMDSQAKIALAEATGQITMMVNKSKAADEAFLLNLQSKNARNEAYTEEEQHRITEMMKKFEVSLAEYFEHEYNKLLDKGKEMQALLLQDRVETLRFICNECSSVAELMAKIEMLFSDNNTGVVFSSVHRAKGLEADNVYILRPDLMPHPKAKKAWETQQEMNGMYVAQTRSKDNLIFVNGGQNV